MLVKNRKKKNEKELTEPYHTASESSASSGSLSNPAMSTVICAYQVSRQSMTADAAESRRNSGRPEKARQENPVHVSLHRRDVAMYANCAATTTHQLRLSTSDAPRRPGPSR